MQPLKRPVKQVKGMFQGDISNLVLICDSNLEKEISSIPLGVLLTQPF